MNTSTKYIYSIILIFIISFNSYAQKRLKYKDIFEILQNQTEEVAYLNLLEYQRQDPEHPNTYFQLGSISHKWAKQSDPLTQYDDTKYFVYNAKLYFGLAKGKLMNNERDVRKNREYYQKAKISDDEDKLEYEDVITYIDKQIEDIKEFEKNIDLIVHNYNSTVSFYNHCIDLFIKINEQKPKIKDIYLEQSDEMRNTIEELAASYDSVQFYFQEYKTAINNYPIKSYNQEFKFKEINTYRLDGLTSSDFLNNKIPIWNYNKWVENVVEKLDYDISSLRKDLDEIQTLMNKKYETLTKANSYSDTHEKFNLNDKLIFKIEKFDYKSIMSSFLLFRTAQLKYLIHFRKNINNPNDTLNEHSIIKRARYYLESKQLRDKSDSLLIVLTSRITKRNVEKYDNFVHKYYNDLTGMLAYVSQQRKLSQTYQETAYANYKKFIIDNENINKSDSVNLPYKNYTIPLYKQDINYDKSIANNYYTTDIKKDKYGNYYLTGYLKQSNNSSQAFVAKTNKNIEFSWVKTSNISVSSYDCGLIIEPTDNGCFVVLNSRFKDKIKNILLKFNDEGRQVEKQNLEYELVPRYLIYDEINENFILAYKGTNLNALKENNGKCIIQKLSNKDETQNWVSELNFSGNLVDIIKMDQDYIIVANFTKYASLEGPEILSNAGVDKTNILIAKINSLGDINSINSINSKKAQFAIKAYKIDSETINLTGLNSIQQKVIDLNSNQPNKLLYVLMNKKGEVYFNNTK